jgi:decaprenylphospho-beta-D-erythro-pentofuranosid-2-ulose 2-reductase
MRNALGQVQSVLVLGGGSDIGLATVRRLIDGGCATVVLAVRQPDQLIEVVRELGQRGASTVEAVRFDARRSDEHEAQIDDWFQRYGDFDVVLLAFGVLGDQETFDKDPASAAEAVAVNYVGAVSSGLAVANRMKAQGHGSIVTLSSVAGERVRKANFVYGSSKAGLDAFAQGLGDSLVGTGVRVIVVRPGFVHTKMTDGLDAAPMSTTAEAVAEAVTKALASNAEVVWVPGQLRVVFGVFKLLPRSVWRRVSARA